ncbi:class I SAM-dependent methyltransferase [Mycobacterium phage jiawei]|uniref:hypothetical protein n=1 Tax=Brevundimonas diminuta TaxID=293 RepID=UPI001907F71C|nr:hypothetical protein [Brevundimonas diminuta]MBK1968386.1 hypothetical protein [Brevundimonas diminuta]WRQ08302.1 class I SAM-dependent methyltransferase [Mycobacterium phage jiawei]
MLPSIADQVRLASDVAALREPAFTVISRIQDVRPADQFRAVMLAALAMAETLGLDAHEEVERARRMMSAAEGPFTVHVQAIRDYTRGELLRR